jgi:hypothetical protein
VATKIAAVSAVSADLAAAIARAEAAEARAAAAEARAARLAVESCDYELVVTTGIPSKFAGAPAWGTVEFVNRRTGDKREMRYVSERTSTRADGATVLTVYANKPAPAAPVASSDAPAAS